VEFEDHVTASAAVATLNQRLFLEKVRGSYIYPAILLAIIFIFYWLSKNFTIFFQNNNFILFFIKYSDVKNIQI